MWGTRGQMPGIFSPISGVHHRRENLFWSSLVGVFLHYGAFSKFQSYFSLRVASAAGKFTQSNVSSCVAGSCPDAPPPRLTPPPWPGGGPASTGGPGSPTWPPPPAGPSQVPPPPTHSHPRWDEMEAARALSQLASSPVQGGSLGAQTAPPPCT